MTMVAVARHETRGRDVMTTKIHLQRSYPTHSRAKVWRALTEPALLAKWLMNPEGFAPVVGTKFKLVAKPQPGWRGFVECEVLEVREPEVLRFSWVGDDDGKQQIVTFALRDEGAGCVFTLDHEPFEGVGGFLLAKLMMGPGWNKMMKKKLSAVLEALDGATTEASVGSQPSA